MKLLSFPAHLQRLRTRYASRGKQGRSRLLDELCDQYHDSRKHAIKLLRQDQPPALRPRRGGAPPRYEPIHEVIERIWKAAEQPCGKRLVEALPLWLPHDAKRFDRLLPCQQSLLAEVSAATLDRLLAEQRARGRRGLSGTRPGSLLRSQIPLQGEVWDEQRPGFLEADSGAHCGSSLAGDFVWSLVYTDIASTWTEGRGVWNKGATGGVTQTRDVEETLPFALRGLDFDNGSEWMNWTLMRHLQLRRAPVQVTRSRPYHKEDNAHVEQKNWMWPRQWLGYGRLDDPAVVPLVNRVYQEAWGSWHNFFLPSMKLRAKWREERR